MRLSADGISHAFRGQPPLFSDLSFEAHPGVMLGLVGPSGSGKSTLLSIVAGFVRPDRGAVHREGLSRIGWIFQTPVGVARRTARDHIMLPLLARGISTDEATDTANDLLHRFHLGALAERQFRHLSGGEAQRLCFARAAASDYDALLLDEPTAQLDPRTADSVRGVIRELVSPTRIVILSTHDEHLRAECDELIDLGEIPLRELHARAPEATA